MPPAVALLVQDIDVTGGSERQAALLAGRLARRGLRVHVASVVHPARLGAPPAPARPPGVPVSRLPWLGLDASLAVWLRARGPFDVLYAVGATLGVVAARAARVVGASPVCKLAAAGPLAGDLSVVASWPRAAREAALAGLASGTVITITDELAAEARAAGLPPSCLVKLGNGVDLEAIAAAPPVGHDSLAPVGLAPVGLAPVGLAPVGLAPVGLAPVVLAPVVLAVGRLDRLKGFDVLLDAWPAVRAAHPTARLHVVGDGPERAALEARARRLEGVQLLGQRDDVAGRLRGATVVVVPSRTEGLSNVLLEAFAAGAPVVASRIPSVVEVAGDGPDGAALLAPPEAPDALAAALALALADEALRARLGAAGRTRVAAWGIDAVADAHAALFARLPRAAPPGRLRFAARFAAARAGDLRRALAARRGQ